MYLAETDEESLFFAGDTALMPDTHALVERVLWTTNRTLDVALLPIGYAPPWKPGFRRGHLTHDDALTLFETLRARVLIPYHWGTFRHVTATAHDAINRLRAVLTTHGGYRAPTSVLAAAIRAGARQAEPGEFTRRAVLNGKLDLLQAEAIGDLVEARSSAAQRQALRQLDGGLSERVVALRERILQVEALLAYDIDFPEEDDGPIPRERITFAA